MTALVEKVNNGPLATAAWHGEDIGANPDAQVVLTTPAIAVTAAATMGAGLGAGLAVAKNHGYLGG
ncbi:hypothetical protein OHR68_29500 [Spirillospora sp. NBC_00431]